MYAIVDHAGKQFRVEKGAQIKVPLTDGEAGKNIQLEQVLLLNNGKETLVGSPTVPGAAVDATIVGHGRDRKIIVFKFKRRKGYQKTQGHRQNYSLLRINDIKVGQAKKAGEAPAKEKPEEKPKASAKKPAAKKPAPAKKATTAKKPAAQKAPAKKAAPKKTTKAASTAKKAAPKKTASKSTAAKKAPAKKAAPKKTTKKSE